MWKTFLLTTNLLWIFNFINALYPFSFEIYCLNNNLLLNGLLTGKLACVTLVDWAPTYSALSCVTAAVTCSGTIIEPYPALSCLTAAVAWFGTIIEPYPCSSILCYGCSRLLWHHHSVSRNNITASCLTTRESFLQSADMKPTNSLSKHQEYSWITGGWNRSRAPNDYACVYKIKNYIGQEHELRIYWAGTARTGYFVCN